MPEIALVFVTQHRDRSYAEEAIDCGAKGYVVKDAAVTELPMALEALEAGQIYQSALVK
jgi:DNA-binding NarL/FixJ family response regulator